MRKPRDIKPKSPFHYADHGAVDCKQDLEHDGVKLEVHFCTVYLNRKECFQLILSELQAANLQWGKEFLKAIQLEMERL